MLFDDDKLGPGGDTPCGTEIYRPQPQWLLKSVTAFRTWNPHLGASQCSDLFDTLPLSLGQITGSLLPIHLLSPVYSSFLLWSFSIGMLISKDFPSRKPHPKLESLSSSCFALSSSQLRHCLPKDALSDAHLYTLVGVPCAQNNAHYPWSFDFSSRF